MTLRELKRIEEVCKQLAAECDTPEKAKAVLIKIGYLDSDGNISKDTCKGG